MKFYKWLIWTLVLILSGYGLIALILLSAYAARGVFT